MKTDKSKERHQSFQIWNLDRKNRCQIHPKWTTSGFRTDAVKTTDLYDALFRSCNFTLGGKKPRVNVRIAHVKKILVV